MRHHRLAFGVFATVLGIGSAAFATPVPMSATIHIDNDWGSGYCATVHLTNTGTVTTASWTATLDLNGTKVGGNPWNANASYSGTVMTLTSVSFNGMIQPGKSIEPASSSPGFCATGTQPRPTTVTATGVAANCATYYYDADKDGFGNPGSALTTCTTPPAGYVAKGGDCCDSDSNVYPGQTGYFQSATKCGGFDYDCSGAGDLKSNGPTGCFETPMQCVLNSSKTGCDAIPTSPLPAACGGKFVSFKTAPCGQTWYIDAKGCAFYGAPAGPGCTSWGNGGPGGTQACK